MLKPTARGVLFCALARVGSQHRHSEINKKILKTKIFKEIVLSNNLEMLKLEIKHNTRLSEYIFFH